MKLLLTAEHLDGRRAIARGPLAPLAQSLAADLEPLHSREIFFPKEKALLSREGGRCARDGTLLDFDPFQPDEHRCPKCGEVYRGALHYRFWIYWYQLWLAERAVHAAVLGELLADARMHSLSASILDGYADRYLDYPNVDNVLGPTRLFFSTYLESIWLQQICIATDFIARCDAPLAGRVLDRIVEPSRAIIAEYDERGSNRQVWNDAALLAAARLLGDESGAERVVFGESGVAALAMTGLLADGTWYEGENYHLFAHRGLWYGLTMADRAGMELADALSDRFDRGFVAPFATALPDFTLPSRRDSQYAISLRQWRIAEHCELGLARRDDATLVGALRRMYEPDIPRRPTGRDRSSADAERNAQPSALTRADLSWRALLFARAELPAGEIASPRSALLEEQGIAVLRRDEGSVYVALDYGHSGGGHGHADRLNMLFVAAGERWLDDFGTGSYTDPSLHWYRSTLAHNAPLVNRRSQRRVDGELVAYDERGAAGWVFASTHGTAPGVAVERIIVVMPGYFIDELHWSANEPVTLDLPFHANLLQSVAGLSPEPHAVLIGGDGMEDGFAFVHHATAHSLPATEIFRGIVSGLSRAVGFHATSDAPTEWWTATAPGAPYTGEHTFTLVRALAAKGRHRFLWSWSDDVAAVDFSADNVAVRRSDGTRETHSLTDAGWHIDLHAGDARSSIDLAGFVGASQPRVAELAQSAPGRGGLDIPRSGRPVAVALGEPHYRRSEQSWNDAGSPSAMLTVAYASDALHVSIDVARSDRTFVPQSAINPYDNESPDINGDGVQLYVAAGDRLAAWVLVPDPNGDVRRRQIEGWNGSMTIEPSWMPTDHGYRLDVVILSLTPPTAIDVIVNEMPRGRERRRGQLVLSGGAGEFIYLRGDRHEPARLIPLRLTND